MTRTARHCPHCDSSAAGCDTLQLLAGRTCCTACPGTHQPPRSADQVAA